jgi:hypothetical protein
MPRPLYELLFGPFETIPVDPADPAEDAAAVVDDVWHLHGYHDWPEDGTPPYGCADGTTIPKSNVATAVIWAELFIAARTPYRVVGWSGMVPKLEETRHTLVVELVTGNPLVLEVGDVESAAILAAFDTPKAFEVDFAGYRSQMPAMRDTITTSTRTDLPRTLRINLNYVVLISQTIRRVPVERFV